MKKCDCLIIGSGTAGAKIAKEFAKRDKQVVMIEKDFDVFGGACINTACIPTKVLSEDSNHSYSYEEAFARKNHIVEKFQASKYKSLNGEKNITLCKGEARFISDEIVEVVTADGPQEFTADHIIINTGSVNNIPPIEGINETENIYTSTTILEKSELPERITIIGGGYVGLEFASMYANFGAKVSVLLRDAKLLPFEDEDIATEIQQVLEEKGIQFFFQTEVEKVDETDGIVTAHANREQQFTSDALLLATGRKPNINDLQLENTSIEVTDKNTIQINDTFQTAVKNIFAVGDVKGEEQFTYVSYDDGRKVVDHVFGNGNQLAKPRKHVQYTMFIDPPLSRVGLTEEAAKEEGYKVLTKKVPVRTIGRAYIIRDTRGLFKAVVDEETDQILGVSLFGPRSEELINIVKIAMDANWHYQDMRDHMFNHPVMGEALNGLFKF